MEQEFEKFRERIREEIKRLCEDSLRVSRQNFTGNNGSVRRGLELSGGEEPVGIQVSLESCYEDYRNGGSVRELAVRVLKEYQAGRMVMDMAESMAGMAGGEGGCESVRDRIVYRLVSYERNKEWLCQTPFIRVCDLAVVFCLAGKEDGIGRLTAMIGNEWAGKWGLGLKELYGLAAENTPRLFPARIKSMREVMEGIAREHLGEAYREEVVEELFSAPVVSPLYVISNEAGNWGAATVLYQGVLKGFSDQVGKDLILLPSSVHEFLIIPWEERLDMGELRDLVIHVNQSEVSEEEILSDQVYRYRRETDRIEEVFQGPGARDSAQAMEAENKEKDFI